MLDSMEMLRSKLSPAKYVLMKELHQILVWIRTHALKNEEGSNQTVAALANLTHNWPDWIAGNDFWTVQMFADEIREESQRTDIVHPFWKDTVAPYLANLADLLEGKSRED